jgi:hypothetical protein
VRFHGRILINGAAYNTADETIAFHCRRFASADALRVGRLGPVSSAGARAAVGSANQQQYPQYLRAVQRGECGQSVCEPLGEFAGSAAAARQLGWVFADAGAIGLLHAVRAEFQSAVGQSRRAVWQLAVLLPSVSGRRQTRMSAPHYGTDVP